MTEGLKVKSPPYLIYSPSSGNSYYFRSWIPKDLRSTFGGLKEFRISLKCGIRSRSNKICRRLNKIVSEIYDQVRTGMKKLDIEDIKEILRIEIRKQILHAHHVDLGTNKWDESKKMMSLDSVKQRELLFRDTLKNDLRTYNQELDVKLESIFDSMGIVLEKDSVPYKTLRNHFINLNLLRFEWMKELIEETGKTDDDFRNSAQIKLSLELFPDLKDQSSDISSIEPVRTSISSIPDKGFGKTISVCGELFYERKLLENTSPKEIQTLKQNINDLIEVVGDLPISNLSKEEVSKFITIQSKLPPNRKKSPQFRNLSIPEILKLKGVQPQSPNNVNKRLSKLSVFGNWCVRQGYINQSPFKEMKLSVKSSRPDRKSFSAIDLRKILNPDTYLKWTIYFNHPKNPSHKESRNKKLPSQPSGAKNQLPYYWIFLIGIFSGMRTNEMCQLRLSDVRKEKGIWFMHVEESDQTSVKTQNAIRKVPVHPQLTELGFIDYVGNLKRKKKDRVLWQLTKGRDGYGKQVSRHYNERFLPELGIWEKYSKVLYCTRHTFINKLYSKNVDENIIKELVGHEREFTMKHYGGDPFSPEQLLDEISKVEYSGIKWNKLKI